jgi:hypothetical protein
MRRVGDGVPVLAALHERADEAKLRVRGVRERRSLFEEMTRTRGVTAAQSFFTIDEQLLPGLRMGRGRGRVRCASAGMSMTVRNRRGLGAQSA